MSRGPRWQALARRLAVGAMWGLRLALSGTRRRVPPSAKRKHHVPPPGALAIVACLLATSLAIADDWPQFLGPQRNGVSAETGLAASWPKEGPPVVWQRDVGEGYSGPVLTGDRL